MKQLLVVGDVQGAVVQFREPVGEPASAGYPEVMAELCTVRDELRQVQQRLDRLEERSGPGEP